jgi:beta-lactamase superfamily II metal-dependent hydrolase
LTIIKSLSVGDGDTYYIRHNSNNFSIIDCNLTGDRDDEIITELKAQRRGNDITRFISTHPDQDHFEGIEKLDAELGILNFYVVKNKAKKDEETVSFKHYCKLRDDVDKAFYLFKGCRRKWMNSGDDERSAAGISVLWPDISNAHFKTALNNCNEGKSFNNLSTALRYSLESGATVMWLGDLETQFMKDIEDSIELEETTILFAPHHGRNSGKVPNSWLDKLKPKVIVIGEAPSRHLNYYNGYKTVTQNKAGDITMELVDNKVHIYSSETNYSHEGLANEKASTFPNYVGTVTV